MSLICIKNQKLCCPVCSEQLQILGTVICKDSDRGFLAECLNQECRILVRFNLDITAVIEQRKKLSGNVDEQINWALLPTLHRTVDRF